MWRSENTFGEITGQCGNSVPLIGPMPGKPPCGRESRVSEKKSRTFMSTEAPHVFVSVKSSPLGLADGCHRTLDGGLGARIWFQHYRIFVRIKYTLCD